MISRTRLTWYRFVAVLCLALTVFAVLTAYLDGTLGEFFGGGLWRDALFYPALVTYILAIIPPLHKSDDDALKALQPLVQMDDDSFERVLDDTSVVTPRGELIALGVGVAFGVLAVSPWQAMSDFSWTSLYWLVAHPLQTGLLAWSVYAALSGTKPIAVVHRHLKDVDILDLGRFEPIGRHSLLSSLTFVGGGAIHLFFHLGSEHTFAMGSLVVYGFLVLVSALVFSLSMRQTHGVLAAAKQQELHRAQSNIISAYRSLEGIPVGSPDISSLSAKLDLWRAYERRLKGVSTWPYNLGMLRTFAVSVFTPIAISLVQRLVAQLLG